MKPTFLIATTSYWFPTARLAMALADVGCIVEAVCPAGHPLGRMSAVQRTHAYRGLRPLRSFWNAIGAVRPDLIIPGDDLATAHLHHLYDQERQRGQAGQFVRDLIERSLGAPESFAVVYSRTAFMDMARQSGVRAPQTKEIANVDALREWIARTGLPTVLKANCTSGGEGVRVVNTIEKAERAFRDLQSPPLLARAAKRAVVDQDKSLVWPSLLRRRAVVNGQVFVPGCEATSTVACWKGTVLASLHFEVVNKRSSAGPSSVLRLIENAEMSTASEKLVRKLSLSGIHGFDFMLETQSGNAHLIEINPRATQVGHLPLGSGRDLPAALYSAVSGEPFHAAPSVTDSDTITLFPQEWMRDPASAFLASGYHDVPWGEPELLRACLRKRTKLSLRDFRLDRLPSFATSTVRAPRL